MSNLHESYPHLEQNRDEVIDLRSAKSPEAVQPDVESEAFKDEGFRNAVNRVLLLGLAAREVTPGTLILRRDKQLNDGRWLQAESVSILRDAIEAGKDRVDGKFSTESPHHSVYDQLFDRVSVSTHFNFVSRLEWLSSVKWSLMNDAQFEMRTEERQLLKDTETRIAKASNKLFRDLFYKIATSDDVPEKYTNMLEDLIEPAIAAEFLRSNYWQDALQYTSKVYRTNVKDYRYYSWIREQEKKLRVRNAGKLALWRGVEV